MQNFCSGVRSFYKLNRKNRLFACNIALIRPLDKKFPSPHHVEQGLVRELVIFLDGGEDAEDQADQHNHEPGEKEKQTISYKVQNLPETKVLF